MKNKTDYLWSFMQRLVLMALFLGLGLGVQAQTSVTGTITDTSGETMIGVSVMLKGTSTGTITDIDGRFQIAAKQGDILAVSYIGYKTQEVKVTGTLLKIVLQEDAQNLEEVVVVGYGTQKKVNLTGAVSAVGGEELSKRPVANTSTMLQGQMPGLRVTSDRGIPGDENV